MLSEYITTEEYINANRSPPLLPTKLDYRSTETPPPIADNDVVDDEGTGTLETRGEGCATDRPNLLQPAKSQPRPSIGDYLLINLLGPNYPEVACRAAKELITPSPDLPWEDRKPDLASTEKQMVYDRTEDAGSSRAEARILKVAAFEASQTFNAVLENGHSTGSTPSASRVGGFRQDEVVETRTDIGRFITNRHRNSIDERSYSMSEDASFFHASKPFNVKPPPRTSLPPIKTNSPPRDNSLPPSTALAKFVIAPIEQNSDQQLPRMHGLHSTTTNGIPAPNKQTLPSLETALSALSADSTDSIYSGRSPSLSRPTPTHLPPLGPSPSSYSNALPAAGLSPPRLSSAPAYWRTISRETTDSNNSDHTSGAPSAGISTPASSAPALSPSESAHTPATIVHDTDGHDVNYSATPRSVSGPPSEIDAQYAGSYCGGNFKCTWPGCNAAPFQTQYLLNSHANVHSNTRPHFCPVQGCPRGPGGQGFKRKNEMIRHGLVHQSPGYVCPFCPDQQHKYPRPDNLQRHVRVHHVDKDRDDPQLRDVLAQRSEGGNRGRRRRLGS